MLLRELKVNLKTLLLYSVILSVMFLLVFGVYPSLITPDTKVMLDEMMQSMPKEMLEVFNMDIMGIEDAYGWFKTEGYIFLSLIGSVFASILGATILVKEESDKTINFLYAKPINRSQIVTAKILCGIIYVFVFNVIVTLLNFIALKNIETFKLREFFMISVIPILVYYLFFFTSLFISTFMRKTKKSMMCGIIIVFVSYVMQFIGGITADLEILKNISYFEFASARYVMLNNNFDMKYLIIGILLIGFFTIATYFRYNKKEFI